MSEDYDPYHGLTQLDPSEWLNIPKPIVIALRVFKELAIEHTNKLQDFSMHLTNQQAVIDEDFRRITKDIGGIKLSISKQHEETLAKVEETAKSTAADINKFKINLGADLDYKQKNNDKEQIFHIKKSTSALPTIHEIEVKINDTATELRNRLKTEIKDTMITPEVKGLSYDIRESSQNLKNLICEVEDRVNDRGVKVLNNVEELKREIEGLQRRVSGVECQQGIAADQIEKVWKRFEKVGADIEDRDRMQSTMSVRLDAKFGPINKTLSSLQTGFNKANEKLEELLSEMEYIKEAQNRVDTDMAQLIISNENDLKNKVEAKDIQISSVEVEDTSKSFRRSTSLINTSSGATEKALQDFKAEMLELKSSLLKSAKETQDKLNHEVASHIKALNEKVKKIREENEESFKEVREKLNWFPVNLSQISGMSASEARLFTLEARLRSEENTRIKSFNFMIKLIENMKDSREGTSKERVRKETPDGFNYEVFKRFGEADKKSSRENYMNLIESGHDEHTELLRRRYKTPKGRELSFELSVKDTKPTSVMGKRLINKSLI